MEKELIRVPRVLGENYNSTLIERLYSSGGSVMLDLIIYLSSYHVKDLFGESWFSIEDFCRKMGYERSNLHRKLTEKQMVEMFGKKVPPKYLYVDGAGRSIEHPIETVFEAALYKLGMENLYFPIAGNDGRTSYNFVQIVKRLDIITDFNTRKSTKRLYMAVLSPEIKNFMFSLYNLLELQDYRNLPSKYRYFYLELAKMIHLIKFKSKKGEESNYTLTVDQLAKKLDIDIPEPKYRKKKIGTILKKINEYLRYTNFDYKFIKGVNERWAYTVAFTFTSKTLQYFDEGQYAVVTNKFYKELIYLYAEISKPEVSISSRYKVVDEIIHDPNQFCDFLSWANSSQCKQRKKDLYVKNFLAVFDRLPEGEEIEPFEQKEIPDPKIFMKLIND